MTQAVQFLIMAVVIVVVGGGIWMLLDRFRPIAGRLYRSDQVAGGNRIGIGDVRLFGRVVHRRLHAVELVELAFDAVGT